uniref:sulfatase/phosphatase domain-containing protein n=1 Tax=Persicitalea sp. TaxID=3100273 RepID=UPI0035945D2A
SAIDLAPTILQVAGIEKPAEMPGLGLQKIFTNQKTTVRYYAFSERNWHGIDEHMRSVRTDRYKLIVNGAYEKFPFGSPSDIAESPSWLSLYEQKQAGKLSPAQQLLFQHPRTRVELFDLKNDPYELENIARDPAQKARVKSLTTAIAQWSAETKDVKPTDHIIADKTDRYTGRPLTKN